MPEGDSIFRTAQALHRHLAGRIVTRFESVFPALTRIDHDRPLAGRTVEGVGLARETHPDDVFRRPRAAHAHADERQLAWLSARRPVAPPVSRHARARGHRGVRRRRLQCAGRRIADVSRDCCATTRCASSVPTCSMRRSTWRQPAFARGRRAGAPSPTSCSTSAWWLVSATSSSRRPCLPPESIRSHRRQMSPTPIWSGSLGSRAICCVRIPRLAAASRPRVESGRAIASIRAGALWVYGRGGKPCRKCGTPIEAKKTGLDARVTYWCPNCQPTPSEAGLKACATSA